MNGWPKPDMLYVATNTCRVRRIKRDPQWWPTESDTWILEGRSVIPTASLSRSLGNTLFPFYVRPRNREEDKELRAWMHALGGVGDPT